MARQRKEPDVQIQVAYLEHPEHAQAAAEILKLGFRRAYVKLLSDQQKEPQA